MPGPRPLRAGGAGEQSLARADPLPSYLVPSTGAGARDCLRSSIGSQNVICLIFCPEMEIWLSLVFYATIASVPVPLLGQPNSKFLAILGG